MNINDAVNHILGHMGFFLSDIDTDKADKIYNCLDELCEGYFEDGRAEGYEDGYSDGYDEGFDDGHSSRYDKGFDTGKISGYNNGRSE